MLQTDVKFNLNVHAHFANIPLVNPYSADLFGPKELSTNYVCWIVSNAFDNTFYQSHLILTQLFQHNLINVSYLMACYLYQVMMTLHFLNDVANDAESTQKSKSTS